MKPVVSCLAAASLTVSIFAAPTDDADRAALLNGVADINTGGTPGGLSVFGADAFAVVAGRDGKKSLLPVIAAARWEKGRVVAFGHDGFVRTVGGNGALLANSARWACGDAPNAKVGVVNNPALLEHLKGSGLDCVSIGDRNWTAELTGLTAVCVAPLWLATDDVAPLEKFIRAGGGLVTGATGWGWLQIHKKEKQQLAVELEANRLLAGAGLVFSAGMPGRTLPQSFATGGDLTLLNATTALQAVTDHTSGKSKLTPDQLSQCSATLADTVRSIPPNDPLFFPKLAKFASQPVEFPSPTKPMRAADALARLSLTLELERERATPPEQIQAHPAASTFPGSVPKSAPLVADRVVPIDVSIPLWHSTGLYAVPGKIIRITIPPQVADKGLGVRIGCHTDSLWHLDSWQRVPEISRRDPLKEVQTVTASAFGGLIYIDVPENLPKLTIDVTISGGVEAPHFVLGKTSADDWKVRIRDNPAPWAELETKKIILSVPSEKIRLLDNPGELMTLWDRILDAEADLTTISRERKRPERIVPDLQISAGYMHSGYPIMTFLDHSVELSLSPTELGNGSWGHFHELGHNHQQSDWTFDGTTEVTCNLYSLYVMETLCGKPPGQGHEAMEPAAVDKRLRSYLALTDKFPRWKSDPFLALIMYDQLRAGFGWGTFKKVFAEYRALPNTARPGNDDEKRDQWLVRFSRAAGRNLGPFFEAWGVPTSAASRQSIAELPGWMPADWPKLQ